jgi:hypothetical protein
MQANISRKTLAIALVLSAIAVAACFYVLHYALLPYHKPKTLSSIDIGQLKPGHLLTHQTESLRYFVIRPGDGNPYVLAVPMREGELFLPDQFWWKPQYACRDFALNVTDGVVTDKSVFHCRDNDLPKEWLSRWQWDLQGKHVGSVDGGKIDAMYQVDFKRSGDKLTITGLTMN